MQQRSTRLFPFEDLTVGCVALIAAVVCALALFDVPGDTATRGVSYTEFVRAPAIDKPLAPAHLPEEQPRVAELPLEVPARDLAGVPLSCSPDARAELHRLMALCQG